jgi:hypothetical protein
VSGILTSLCGGLVLIAGWQYRHKLAGLIGLLMVLLPWLFDRRLQAILSQVINA